MLVLAKKERKDGSLLTLPFTKPPFLLPVGVLDLREAFGSMPQQRGRFIRWSPSKSPPYPHTYTHAHIPSSSHTVMDTRLIIESLIISYTQLCN